MIGKPQGKESLDNNTIVHQMLPNYLCAPAKRWDEGVRRLKETGSVLQSRRLCGELWGHKPPIYETGPRYRQPCWNLVSRRSEAGDVILMAHLTA